MDKKKLLELAGKILVAGATNNDAELNTASEELAAAMRQHSDEDEENYSSPLIKDTVGFLKFTEKEILKMPKQFRPTFRANGRTVHVRKRKRSNRGYHYEARYRCDGYNISISSTDYEKLKPRFIEALLLNEAKDNSPEIPTRFDEFALFYFEKFRKRKVAEETYAGDMRRLKNHLIPALGNMQLKNITPVHCQNIIDCYIDKRQSKTAEELFSLLNQIFKMAIAHGLVFRNPCDVVIREPHEREHGVALSKDEEHNLLTAMAGTRYQVLFAVVLYTGLRPNEYKTARIEGDFIVAVNSKRKTKKVEYKKIPVTPMLRPYLFNVTELRFPRNTYLRNKLKSILPAHKLYDLRTTFYTRCQECGVAEVAKMEYVGHSLGKLGNTYTDLSDEFLLKEGKKFDY